MVRFGPDDADHKGFVENISDTGLLLTSKHVLPPQTRIRIEFTLGDSPGILEGVVRWARRMPPSVSHVIPSGMGVRLTSAPSSLHDLVAALDRKRAR
jgi:hypothetical protein